MITTWWIGNESYGSVEHLTADADDYGPVDPRAQRYSSPAGCAWDWWQVCLVSAPAETAWWIIPVAVHWNMTTGRDWYESSSSSHCRCRHWDPSQTGLDGLSPHRPWHRCLEYGGDDGQVHTRRTPSWAHSVAICCSSFTATYRLYSDMLSCSETASCGRHRPIHLGVIGVQMTV